MENLSGPEKKPTLFLNNYSIGEVRLCIENKRVFNDPESQNQFLVDAWKKIKPMLNSWSRERYGRELFGGYSDGDTIRVQTGLHELTSEDREKIEQIMSQSNEEV